MMKKIIWILVLCYLFSVACIGCCSAEEKSLVSLRGGITFSSTKDDILKYEEQENTHWSDPDNVVHFLSTDNCLIAFNVSIAGFDNCSEVFYFNEDDTLSSVQYCFIVEDRASADKKFTVLDDALSKYGDPICVGGEDYIEINEEPNAIEAMNRFRHEESWSDDEGYGDASLISLKQRLVKEKEGYIDIQIVEYNMHQAIYQWLNKEKGQLFNTMEFEYFPVIISYTYCNEEQMNVYNDKIRGKYAALSDDL